MKVFGLAFVLVSLSSSFASQCQFHPRFWCSSPEIAKQCGVYEQCKLKFFSTNLTSDPVKIEVYFESFCPDSRNFVTKQLAPTFEQLKESNVFEPTLVPYGKARYTQNAEGNWVFVCQHGQKECEGNKIMNCIIKYSNNDPKVHILIISCMIGALGQANNDPIKAAPQCVTDGGMMWDTIHTCVYETNEGSDLLHTSGVKTEQLNPALNWVPWIVSNGVHTDEIQQAATTDFMKYVCDTYQGTLPDACKSSSNIFTGSPLSLSLLLIFSSFLF